MTIEIIEKELELRELIICGNPVEDLFRDFQELVWLYYTRYGRPFPWRETRNAYHILVSEVMLQQTQTSRVEQKYPEFIEKFPDVRALADAQLREVLEAWQGLGYNRRAVALYNAAKTLVEQYGGQVPDAVEELVKLEGVGKYTAAAVVAFAFNRPAVFIETNIRTVYTYFFFNEADTVKDNDILPLIESTLDRENVREWYYALFDYGVFLKRRTKLNQRSAHYRKQGRFVGSNRQLRGRIIRLILGYGVLDRSELGKMLDAEDPISVNSALGQLIQEGFLIELDGKILVRGE